MKKLLEENETLMQIANDAGLPACPHQRDGFHQSKSQNFPLKNLANNSIVS